MKSGLQYILATSMLLSSPVQSGSGRSYSLPELSHPASNLSHKEQVKLRVPNYEKLIHFTCSHEGKKITGIDVDNDEKLDLVYVGEKGSFFQSKKLGKDPLKNKYFKAAQTIYDVVLESNAE